MHIYFLRVDEAKSDGNVILESLQKSSVCKHQFKQIQRSQVGGINLIIIMEIEGLDGMMVNSTEVCGITSSSDCEMCHLCTKTTAQ